MSNEPEVTVVVVPRASSHGFDRAVASALNQSVENVEVLLFTTTGDAAPSPCADDRRVRILSSPHGPATLTELVERSCREARSPFVCYLSADDLWLPDHLTVMAELLRGADLGHTLQLDALPGGKWTPHPVALDRAPLRDLLAEGNARVELGSWGHRTSLLLPAASGVDAHTDDGVADTRFWRRLLADGNLRAARSSRPTVVHFSSELRGTWSPVYVEQERDFWARRLEDLGQRHALQASVSEPLLDALLEAWVNGLHVAAELRDAKQEVLSTRSQAAELERTLQAMQEDVRRLEVDCQLLDADRRYLGRVRENNSAMNEALRRKEHELQTEIERLETSATWRIKERVAEVPLVSDILRKVVRVLAN